MPVAIPPTMAMLMGTSAAMQMAMPAEASTEAMATATQIATATAMATATATARQCSSPRLHDVPRAVETRADLDGVSPVPVVIANRDDLPVGT